MTDQVQEQDSATPEVTQPIFINLGKQSPKRIKALKQGSGKLWDEVSEVLKEVRTGLGDEAAGKVLVPVILVYRKRSRRRGVFPLLPMP